MAPLEDTEFTLLFAPEAAEDAEETADEVEEERGTRPVVLLLPSGAGVTREVEEAVAAQVAEEGRFVMPCPAQRESANLIVATPALDIMLDTISATATHPSDLPHHKPYSRNMPDSRSRSGRCKCTSRPDCHICRSRPHRCRHT